MTKVYVYCMFVYGSIYVFLHFDLIPYQIFNDPRPLISLGKTNYVERTMTFFLAPLFSFLLNLSGTGVSEGSDRLFCQWECLSSLGPVYHCLRLTFRVVSHYPSASVLVN